MRRALRRALRRAAALAPLAAMVLGGCDLVQESFLDERPALMRQLDGTWAITTTTAFIYPDGSVVPQPALTRSGTAEIASAMVCPGQTQINAAGDADRILKLTGFDNRCYVVTTDHEQRRLVFVGEGSLSTDVPYTIDEASGSRQVWSAYTLTTTGAYVSHQRFTLTK